MNVKDAAKHLGVALCTYYRWKTRLGVPNKIMTKRDIPYSMYEAQLKAEENNTNE